MSRYCLYVIAVFVKSICIVLLVSLLSTYVLDSPTPVEIRIFDFEIHDENNLIIATEIETTGEQDEDIQDGTSSKNPLKIYTN